MPRAAAPADAPASGSLRGDACVSRSTGKNARVARNATPAAPTADAPDAPWCVYLLECADGTYYCGITNDLPRRFAQHNGERTGGAKYTRTRRPVTLRAHALCADKSAALQLEYRVRTKPRAQKILFLQHLHAQFLESH